MASTHFGSAIWSYICRSTGAIFWLTRPATIIRSAWRGVFEARSMPNLARSCRGPPVEISSIAQQARPNVAGQTELLRAYPATFSTVVSRMPLGSFSSRPISVPLQTAAPPDVGVRDKHRDDEQHHLDQPEQPEPVEGYGPRVKEDDLDVEHDEEHRGQVVLHREPDAGRLTGRLDAALVGLELGPVPAFRARQRS